MITLTDRSLHTRSIGFADNPYILEFSVNPKAWLSSDTFRHVDIELRISNGTSEITTSMTQNAVGMVFLDVSEAFRAFYDHPDVKFNISPVNFIAKYELAKAFITIRGKALYGGNEVQRFSYEIADVWCMPGGRTAEERYHNAVYAKHRGTVYESADDDIHIIADALGSFYLCTRPYNTTMLVGLGDLIIRSSCSKANIQSGRLTCKVGVQTAAKEGPVIADDYTYHVIDDPRRRELIFLNSFRMPESASLIYMEEIEQAVKSQSYEARGTGTFVPDGRIINENTVGPQQWKMSSGYVTAELAAWFIAEVGTAHETFIYNNGMFIPVYLSVQSSVISNGNSADMCHVEFIVTSALKGRIDMETKGAIVQRQYSVEYRNADGSVLEKKAFVLGEQDSEEVVPEAPYKFRFIGWIRDLEESNDNTVVYNPVFEQYIFTAKFYDCNNKEMGSEDVEVGKGIHYPSIDNVISNKFMLGWSLGGGNYDVPILMPKGDVRLYVNMSYYTVSVVAILRHDVPFGSQSQYDIERILTGSYYGDKICCVVARSNGKESVVYTDVSESGKGSFTTQRFVRFTDADHRMMDAYDISQVTNIEDWQVVKFIYLGEWDYVQHRVFAKVIDTPASTLTDAQKADIVAEAIELAKKL